MGNLCTITQSHSQATWCGVYLEKPLINCCIQWFRSVRYFLTCKSYPGRVEVLPKQPKVPQLCLCAEQVCTDSLILTGVHWKFYCILHTWISSITQWQYRITLPLWWPPAGSSGRNGSSSLWGTGSLVRSPSTRSAEWNIFTQINSRITRKVFLLYLITTFMC